MLTRLLRDLWNDEDGATAIEYALLAALVTILALAGLSAFGESASQMWTNTSNTITTAMSS